MERPRLAVHILYTLHRFWPAVGGTELAMMDLGQEVRKLGHEVTLATSDEPGSPAVEDVRGLDVHRFALRRAGKFRFPPAAYKDFVLHGGDWDVVHVKGQRVWSSDYLWRHVPKIRQPKVFTAHGFHQWHMHRRDPAELWYYKWHLPRVLRPFDRIVALTGNEVDELVSWGVPREKIVILPDGVNLHEFEAAPARGFREKHGIPADKKLLLYAGGFYDNKGVPLLVEAAARCESDVELVLIGKDPAAGSTKAETERLIAELKAPVRILGVVPREDLVKAFFESDLFLMGSRFEGYGIVLLEAMAARLPFVSTPAGAAPDLAAKGAGLVVRTATEMANAVDELLGDEQRRKEMGERGRRLALEQTLEAQAKKHVALYESLLASR